MRAKLVNEKFTEKSDPVQDLGIGRTRYRAFKPKGKSYHILQYYKGRLNLFGQWVNVPKPLSPHKKAEKRMAIFGAGLSDTDRYVNDFNVANLKEFTKKWPQIEKYLEYVKKLEDKMLYDKKEKIRKKKEAEDKRYQYFESLQEKFSEKSDPIHDLGIGYFQVVKQPRNVFHFIERGPDYVEGRKPTTYVYSMDKGNVYRTHPNLYAHQELRSNSHAFNKGNPDKMAIPNDFDKAYAFIINHYMKKRKRAGMSESVNEKFKEKSDPIEDLGIGYSKRTLDSKSFKILEFIGSKGKEGASLTEIQHFIWTELDGYDEKSFWQTSAEKHPNPWGSAPKQRATRGHWNTQLFGGMHYHEGLLHKYCEKNPVTKKWVLKRMPAPKEKMYAWPKYR